MGKKKLLLSLILSVSFQGIFFANIFNRPRTIKVLSTRYFDFIFPKGSEKLVAYLSEDADNFFDRAKDEVALQKTFRLPVAITLDSDTLNVEYTSDPYNRITIYAAPSTAVNRHQKDALKDSFNEAVTKAVFSSKRSKFWQLASDLAGMDALQPAALLNIPSAFMDGAVNASVYGDGGIVKDGFSLSMLAEAKSEGNFPSWLDAVGARDIHPASISKVASSAFAAYIQSRFGLEKYKKFFEETGKVKFFKVTAGIFREVYGKNINEVWNDFENSIPTTGKNIIGKAVFKDDSESLYSFLIATEKGLVFYDSSHREVSRLSKLSNIDLKERLFAASDVTGLSCSEDRKKLVVSYKSSKTNRSLSKYQTSLYNLEKSIFMGQRYEMTCGKTMRYSIDTEAVAGFHAEGIKTEVKIYPIEYEFHKNELYSKELPTSAHFVDIIPTGIGKIICIYYSQGECVLHFIDVFYNTEKCFALPYTAMNFKKENETSISFTFTKENSYESGKRGIIILGEEGRPKAVKVQQEDFKGGIYDSVMLGGKMFFSNHTGNREELRFTEEEIQYGSEEPIRECAPPENPDWENADEKIVKGTLNDYRISRYNFLKYSLKGSWLPFFPISTIDFTKTQLSPGLGASYVTNQDPLENFFATLSFCAGFIDITQKTFTLQKGYTLAGFFNTTVFPFDIALGGLWKFNDNGSYDIQVLLGTEWNSIIGFSHNRLSFGVKGMWNASTTYYNWEKDSVTELSGWPSIDKAYNTLSANLSMNYSNVRQWGFSSFEKIGLTLSTSFITIFDPQKAEKDANSNKTTQLTISLDFGFNIPFIIPVFALDNWVVCMPLEFHTEWYGKGNTLADTYAEVLLAGYEVQKGIPWLNIFVQRVGIKAGYDLNLKYNTLKTEDPDIRNLRGFVNVIKESELNDYFYINIEATLSPAVGKFSSSSKITAGLQFQMNYRKHAGNVKAILNMNI